MLVVDDEDEKDLQYRQETAKEPWADTLVEVVLNTPYGDHQK